MPYWIVIVGVIVFIINLRRWKKIKFTINQESRRKREYPPVIWFISLCNEWRFYALGNRTLKGAKGLIMAAVAMVVMIILNANWLGIRWDIFLPVVLASLFIAQLRIGRLLLRRDFENRFPEVLAVVNAAVSAGNSIHQALGRCGKSVDGRLGETFHRIDRRLNLGEEPERVFKDAWQDHRYREFYFFVIVMLVSLERGGQLRVLIGRLSRIIINSKNMARRKAAMTSEARTSAKIVAAIPLLFFCGMKYFSPENFDFIVHDSTGQLILYYVIASETIGMIIIWLLVRRAT
ncbi:secretion system protein [Izhakiella australiensis]|uniref:Secretion system protein n=1 Tax=Izhakiella australiensis TaxID=1926881 RepID=A0A1S8YSV7_9GAMM|nr:type II secretion system F family protein [Izhakiella australiensis]OON42170.1 secretion system protein [Izhakiella australiensis]